MDYFRILNSKVDSEECNPNLSGTIETATTKSTVAENLPPTKNDKSFKKNYTKPHINIDINVDVSKIEDKADIDVNVNINFH